MNRRAGEAFREMTAHRISHCLRRGERNPVRLELRQHMLDRAWAQSFRCVDIGPMSRAPFEESAGKALARALERSRRRDLVRGDVVLEGNAACPRQSPVIVGLAEPAIGDHHRMRQDAPFLGERFRPIERGAVDEAIDQEGIVGGRRVGQSPVARPHAFGMTCCRPPPHATGPHNFPTSIFKLWNLAICNLTTSTRLRRADWNKLQPKGVRSHLATRCRAQ